MRFFWVFGGFSSDWEKNLSFLLHLIPKKANLICLQGTKSKKMGTFLEAALPFFDLGELFCLNCFFDASASSGRIPHREEHALRFLQSVRVSDELSISPGRPIAY